MSTLRDAYHFIGNKLYIIRFASSFIKDLSEELLSESANKKEIQEQIAKYTNSIEENIQLLDDKIKQLKMHNFSSLNPDEDLECLSDKNKEENKNI